MGELPRSSISIRDVFITFDRLFPVWYATEDPGRIIVDRFWCRFRDVFSVLEHF